MSPLSLFSVLFSLHLASSVRAQQSPNESVNFKDIIGHMAMSQVKDIANGSSSRTSSSKFRSFDRKDAHFSSAEDKMDKDFLESRFQDCFLRILFK